MLCNACPRGLTSNTLMVPTAFLPILSALDRLFIDHARGLSTRRVKRWGSLRTGPEPGTYSCVTHVAFGTLVDYVRGLGSAAAREQVREHLATCAHCEQTAGRLTLLTEIAAADADCEVPDDVVDEALALFTADAADRRALAGVDEIFSGQTRRTPLDDGEPETPRRQSGQATGAAPPRFLRFAAPGGEIDVHLLVLEERGAVSVSGQIIARKAGGRLDWEVTAHRGTSPEAIGRTRATEAGLFQLHYDAPAAALLRFANAAAPEPVDLPIET
jgi:anti-sigma factor RsiW